MIPGTPERRSFDYVRHGTIGLSAALGTAPGPTVPPRGLRPLGGCVNLIWGLAHI